MPRIGISSLGRLSYLFSLVAANAALADGYEVHIDGFNRYGMSSAPHDYHASSEGDLIAWVQNWFDEYGVKKSSAYPTLYRNYQPVRCAVVDITKLCTSSDYAFSVPFPSELNSPWQSVTLSVWDHTSTTRMCPGAYNKVALCVGHYEDNMPATGWTPWLWFPHAWVKGENLSLHAGYGATLTDAKEVDKSGPIVANFPLGEEFSLQLTKDGAPVRSRYALSGANISPPLTGPTLFSSHAVIEFDASSPADKKTFRAVHLGTETLTITPVDSSIDAVTVTLTIDKPVKLGSRNNEYDELLIDYGHRKGIPPQFLKGQVKKESNFDPLAYRWEPLSSDYRMVSKGHNLRTQSPYSLYRLATTDHLTQGTDIRNEDISPRSRYKISVDGVMRYITDSDQFVSAKNIYDSNNAQNRRQNWSVANPDEAEILAEAERTGQPSPLEFTAQTPIAASYGLLQILYSTAILPMRWSGIAGARNPSYLFDTEANRAVKGGSLTVGADYLTRVFPEANSGIRITDPEFGNSNGFISAFRRAFNWYNRTSASGPYGGGVLSFSASYPPVSSSQIFP